MLKCDLLPTSEAARLNIFRPKFSFQVAPTLDHCGLYPRPIFDTEKKFNLSERKPPATYFSLNTAMGQERIHNVGGFLRIFSIFLTLCHPQSK